MPHIRPRFILEQVEKKMRFSPVVALQGARQTGKSFFAREILKERHPSAAYATFDRSEVLENARSGVARFLERNDEARPFIVDEAQKLPVLFDEVKAVVDEKRIPGRFVLLGSTEFSKLTRVRESLTGRMGRIRFSPFTLAEALEIEDLRSRAPFFLSGKPRISGKQLLRHLEAGGLPGIFSIRKAEDRRESFQDWLSLTLQRDLQSFSGLRLDSDLAERILRVLVRLPLPTAGAVARALRVDLRKVKTHLKALATLFTIEEVKAHPAIASKPVYFLFDVGLASFLGAEFERQVQTLFLQEYLAKRSFSSLGSEAKLHYYTPPRSERFFFVEERGKIAHIIQIFAETRARPRDFYALEAIPEKIGNASAIRMVMATHPHLAVPRGVRLVEWTALG